MNRIRMVFFLVGIMTLSACGGSGGGSGNTEEAVNVESVDSTAPEIARLTEYFGEGGNLWKPKAEEGSSTAGLLVVLLGPQHTDRFDGCEIEHIDGTIEQLDCNRRVEWSHVPYSCVANGGREHWRASFTCDKAAQVRVVCRNSTEELTVEGRGPAISAICSRQG